MHKIRCPKRTNAVTMNSSGIICCTFVTKVVGSLGIPSVCLSILSQIRRFEWFVTCDSLWFVCICINRISGLVLSSWDLMISTWPRRDPSTDCHCATIWIGTALARCWQTWSQIQMNIKELQIFDQLQQNAISFAEFFETCDQINEVDSLACKHNKIVPLNRHDSNSNCYWCAILASSQSNRIWSSSHLVGCVWLTLISPSRNWCRVHTRGTPPLSSSTYNTYSLPYHRLRQ